MNTFLKNYTSNVPISQTIARVEHVLIKCGATSITKDYTADMAITALTFYIEASAGRKLSVRLPVEVEGVLEALWLDYVGDDMLTPDRQSIAAPRGNFKKRRRENFREQAERTAWKLMEDWVAVQMSMISLKQADTLQVFLPYVWDGEQTFYSMLKTRGFKGLLPERTA